MTRVITLTASPGHGDIRRMSAGDLLIITPPARNRKDWSRIAAAIADAVGKGCGVEWRGNEND